MLIIYKVSIQKNLLSLPCSIPKSNQHQVSPLQKTVGSKTRIINASEAHWWGIVCHLLHELGASKIVTFHTNQSVQSCFGGIIILQAHHILHETPLVGACLLGKQPRQTRENHKYGFRIQKYNKNDSGITTQQLKWPKILAQVWLFFCKLCFQLIAIADMLPHKITFKKPLPNLSAQMLHAKLLGPRPKATMSPANSEQSDEETQCMEDMPKTDFHSH